MRVWVYAVMRELVVLLLVELALLGLVWLECV